MNHCHINMLAEHIWLIVFAVAGLLVWNLFYIVSQCLIAALSVFIIYWRCLWLHGIRTCRH